jgi:hypothetical protein
VAAGAGAGAVWASAEADNSIAAAGRIDFSILSLLLKVAAPTKAPKRAFPAAALKRHGDFARRALPQPVRMHG